jgi:hypothetical protein
MLGGLKNTTSFRALRSTELPLPLPWLKARKLL